MSDDLAAKAANWVPPWQRPADGESEGEGAEADPGAEPVAEAGPEGGAVPGQWDRLAGAKWQNVRPGESDEQFPEEDEPADEDPQLSDCMSEEDEGFAGAELSEDERVAAALSGDELHEDAEGPAGAGLSEDERVAVALSGNNLADDGEDRSEDALSEDGLAGGERAESYTLSLHDALPI